jgi:hypothetical protein
MTKKDNNQVNQNVSWELRNPYQILKYFTSIEPKVMSEFLGMRPIG